jgi:hypothetical protein
MMIMMTNMMTLIPSWNLKTSSNDCMVNCSMDRWILISSCNRKRNPHDCMLNSIWLCQKEYQRISKIYERYDTGISNK